MFIIDIDKNSIQQISENATENKGQTAFGPEGNFSDTFCNSFLRNSI